MSHTITIDRQTLSDGSKVFNVHFGNVMLQAINEKDANMLAARIFDAINAHTNDSAKLLYTY